MGKQEVSILLVDDREENLTALEALLADMGLDLVKARSGNEALRLALKHNFALVLMDAQMPCMDGFETAELMRANPKTCHVPIIFVTAGMKDMSYQFKGYDAGAVDYLLKPLEPTILRSKVRIFRDLYVRRCTLEAREASLEALVQLRTAELIRTTENLLASEERYRNAFELAAVGMAHVALDGLLMKVNATMCTILGYAPGELQHLSFADITHADDRAMDEDCVRSLLAGEIGSYEMEKRFVRKDGTVIFGHMAVALARGEKGQPLHYITVIEDVTAHQQLEQQLRQSQKMEAIGHLAGGIAHDFNNLLSVIIGYGNLALMKMEADNLLKPNLSQIIAAAERAAQLTKGLLSISRKQEMKQRPVELNGLIEGVTQILQRVIGEDIQLETSFHPERLYINADSSQIDQVLMNLATNARDAMANGGVLTISTGRLEIEDAPMLSQGVSKAGSYAVINVSDNGGGMDSQTLQNIFDPFFTTKDVGKGTGLGMSIVYGIITRHNGFIKVYSEPGVGTNFRIYLPLIEAGETEVAGSAAAEPQGGSETILIAEDDTVIRDMEVSILRGYGYRVLEAADGQAAIDVFRDYRAEIGLILLDLIMPRKNGAEAFREIKAIVPTVKVLFISGYTADLIKEKGLLEHEVELIMKPISPPDLARKVRELLDG